MSGPAVVDGRAPPSTPHLLTNPASAALFDGRGDLELDREARGATIDWGGVIAQHVRLTGPWRIYLRTTAAPVALGSTVVGSGPIPGGWRTHHRFEGFEIEHDVAALADPPSVVRSLRLAARPSGVTLELVSQFVPFLLPVLVEGIRPTSFRAETGADGLRLRQRAFGMAVSWTVLPDALYLNHGSWLGGRYSGPIESFASQHRLGPGPGGAAEIRWIVAGGLERDLGSAVTRSRALLQDAEAATALVARADEAWTAGTPEMSFPDAPDLERAYRSARAALRRLYTAPEPGMTGLVAGYPWYSAIWCRDLAWALPAVLWLGDADWFAASLNTVFRFQSRGSLPLLGSETGELPMQVAPGPIFLYGTSDTTLHYPGLVRRYLRWTGRPIPAEWRTAVEAAVGWTRGRLDPATGLFRHGGEAESISTATQTVARVRYGIDSPDTTIWDSADRRDSAIDLQVLAEDALRAGATLRGVESPTSREDRERADRLRASVLARYRWAEEGYLADSVRGGAPVRRLRPNALRAVSAGWLDAPAARRAVERAARDDLSAAWGVRTLARSDPSYDPRAYHGGSAWTIATAWAADAAFASGAAALGLGYLRTIADRYERESGYANECYRGDADAPYNSCFLLGFSVAPFLTLLFERLWGISGDAATGTLGVRPAFPDAWRSARIQRLRFGPGTVDLDWSTERLRVRWSGPGRLRVESRGGGGEVAPGSTLGIPTRAGTVDPPESG